MDHLRRELAPISEAAWRAIEEEATRNLRHFLTARPLVDVEGPHGWEHACTTTGRVEALSSPVEGVEGRRRIVRPLVELRRRFTVPFSELDAIDRGAPDPDLSAVAEAARAAAEAEDTVLFYGWPEAGIAGIADASPHDPVLIGDDYTQYASFVARGVAALRREGISGPFALALGPRCHTGVIETTHGGYPILEHVRMILGGPIFWARNVDGAVVVSRRGGDFTMTLGQDWSIGYEGHDAGGVHLYLEESLDFQVIEPAAGIALCYP